ncbi:hypothetical protein F6455_03165 [Proteobacteria bacterium 005FR1]|nr:hypothetical protein [Proteobacteria bacterium 005FR1]
MNRTADRKPANAIVIAAVPAIIIAIFVIFSPQNVLRGYLLAWLGSLHIVLGSMLVLLIHALTGGAWGRWLTTPLRGAVATLPAFALLLIPLWFSMDAIFPSVEGPQMEANQAIWLQPWFLITRSAIMFLIWLALAAGMSIWSFSRSVAVSAGLAALSIIAFVLSTSAFAVDWIMTLIIENSTTMIGFLVISDQLVAALAFAAIWLSLQHWRSPPTQAEINERRKARNDIGNMLLAAAMFHAYCLYMDFLIVWEANLPHEIAWYIDRSEPFGAALISTVAVLMIALPIFLLLFRRIKSSAKGLAAISAMVLLGHFLLIYWYLSPLLTRHSVMGEPGFWAWDGALAVLLFSAWAAAMTSLSRRIGEQTENANKPGVVAWQSRVKHGR